MAARAAARPFDPQDSQAVHFIPSSYSPGMAFETISVGDLTAVIGDNGEHQTHRAGYNGVWSLKHRSLDRNLFVPSYAGLNLEHIFDGAPPFHREVFFEPRHAPMNLSKMESDTVQLHQPPTPTFELESWSRFSLKAPHYLDLDFVCRPHQHVFDYGYIGLFWASYINAPEDKSLYFLGGDDPENPMWLQYCTQFHNDQSTVLSSSDDFELSVSEDYRDALFRHVSQLRYRFPFYYGNFGDLVWIVMFHSDQRVRFSHSPSGGGANRERKTSNPAWDYQLIIPEFEVPERYRLRMRTVLRPRCSREEIFAEYERWTKELAG